MAHLNINNNKIGLIYALLGNISNRLFLALFLSLSLSLSHTLSIATAMRSLVS